MFELFDSLPGFRQYLSDIYEHRTAWVFATKNGRILMVVDEKPIRTTLGWKVRGGEDAVITLPSTMYPDLKWDDEPVKAELWEIVGKMKENITENIHNFFQSLIDSGEDIDVPQDDEPENQPVEKQPEAIETPVETKQPVDKSKPQTFESYGAHLRNLLGTYQFLADIVTEFSTGRMSEDMFKRILRDRNLQEGVDEIVAFSRDEELENLNWRNVH